VTSAGTLRRRGYHSANERISVRGVMAGQVRLREVVETLAGA
jgi:hypothetical protein